MATNESYTNVTSLLLPTICYDFFCHVGKVQLLDKIEKFAKLCRRRLEIPATSSILFPFRPPQQHISSPSNKSRLAYKEKLEKKKN